MCNSTQEVWGKKKRGDGSGRGGMRKSLHELSGWDPEQAQEERSAEREIPQKAGSCLEEEHRCFHLWVMKCLTKVASTIEPSFSHQKCTERQSHPLGSYGSARTGSTFHAIVIQVTSNGHSWHGNQKAWGAQFSKFISQLYLHFVRVWMLIVMLRPVQGQKHIS